MNQHCVTRHEPRTPAQRMLDAIDLVHIRCPVHDMFMPTNGCWWLRYGYFQLKTRGHDRVFIANLWVDERYRGKGYGRAMLNRIMGYADEYGVKLCLYPDPFDAMRRGPNRQELGAWYKRRGFVKHSPRGRYATRNPR